jgi:hypothetical protein
LTPEPCDTDQQLAVSDSTESSDPSLSEEVRGDDNVQLAAGETGPPVTDYRKIVDVVRARGSVHYAKTVIPILRTQGKEPRPDTACPLGEALRLARGLTPIVDI